MMTMEEQNRADELFMRKALAEAMRAGEAGEVPIGAVVTCGGRVIARGRNMTETLCDATAHAEMQAITSAANALGGKYLVGCTLYVTLEPCAMCAGAIFWSQITRVVYGARDYKRGFLTCAPQVVHPKASVVGGILSEECSRLLVDFFRHRR